jgi:hypothetical protein
MTPACVRSSSVASPALLICRKTLTFPVRLRYLQSSDMLGFRRHIRDELIHTTSALLARIQRLEDGQAEMRARLEGERQLRVFTANLAAAAQVAPAIGAAIEGFAEAMRAPLPCGRAGGLARARTAWRYFDGTFMSVSEIEAADLECTSVTRLAVARAPLELRARRTGHSCRQQQIIF